MKRLRHGESCAQQQKTHKSVPKSDPTGPRVESGLPNSLLYTCVCWLHRLPRSWTPPLTFPVSITFPTSSFLPPKRRPCFSRALGKPPSLFQSFSVSLTSPERIKVLHSKGPTCLLPPPPDTEHSTGYHTLLNG